HRLNKRSGVIFPFLNGTSDAGLIDRSSFLLKNYCAAAVYSAWTRCGIGEIRKIHMKPTPLQIVDEHGLEFRMSGCRSAFALGSRAGRKLEVLGQHRADA
ncbi:hypothetical protein, partial [Loktanella sp. SALINAS62]|uniref:hypothetical protein n=1 Tax=Loktanella sp. SALINAS62 TaxID=2706124 RepID=UPI001B8D6165